MSPSNLTAAYLPRAAPAPAAQPRLRVVGGPTQVASVTRRFGHQLLEGRYRVFERLGRGGMASVYRGEHVRMSKPVAIKVLDPQLCSAADQRRRFFREAQAASRLSHPHVIDVADVGATPDGSIFMVMELLRGEPLSATIEREGPLPAERIRTIGLQICDAVGAAHHAGILHRDLKPDNCFRVGSPSAPDFIKVLDFGLAKLARASQLTVAGTVMGTPTYMSPEQAQGTQVDERTDVYAIGIMLYEMATGRVPFDADDPLAVLQQQVWAQPMPPCQAAPHAKIHPRLEALILTAIAKDPSARFATVADLARALAAIPVGRKRSRRAKGALNPLLSAAAFVGAAGLTAMAIATFADGIATTDVGLADVLESVRTLLDL